MFYKDILQGEFVERVNRFTVRINLNGSIVSAHLANSGRLGELLIPGRKAGILYKGTPGRKTKYDFVMIRNEKGAWVSVDATLPNKLFCEGFKQGIIKEFRKYEQIKKEVKCGTSRLDFVLKNQQSRCFIEVKSVTLVIDKTGFFPDAPTARGVKHITELINLKNQGSCSAVVFIVQRPDARQVSPNRETDPDFYNILKDAHQAGVSVFALNCRTGKNRIEIKQQIPVIF